MPGLLGTNAPVVSDLNLFLQIITIVVLFAGVKFGKEKTEQSLKKHKNVMTSVVVLNAVGFIFVMGPSFVNYFSTSLVKLSTFGIVSTSLHVFFGSLAEILGIAFIFNKKPKNIRLWMRLTRWVWIIAFVLGVSLYLQIAGVI